MGARRKGARADCRQHNVDIGWAQATFFQYNILPVQQSSRALVVSSWLKVRVVDCTPLEIAISAWHLKPIVDQWTYEEIMFLSLGQPLGRHTAYIIPAGLLGGINTVRGQTHSAL